MRAKPASFLVVRFNIRHQKGSSRLRKATITIRFNNRPHPSLPNNNNTETIATIYVYPPRRVYCLQTGEEKETDRELWCEMRNPAGTARDWIRRRGRVVPPNLLENTHHGSQDMDGPESEKQLLPTKQCPKSTRTGSRAKEFPRNCTLTSWSSTTTRGAIQADITTSIADRTAWPSSRDDPIILAPGNAVWSGRGLAAPRDFESLEESCAVS